MKKEFYLAVLMLLFCFACGNYKKNLNTETYTSTLHELNEFIEKPDDLLTQKEKDKRDLLFNLVLKGLY